MSRIKRNNDELKAARPTLEEVKIIPKIPISFLVENVRSVHNVGSIFRTADGMGSEKIYIAGYSAYPPRDDLSKVALGAEISVPWDQNDNSLEFAENIKSNGIQLIGLEQTHSSPSIYEIDWQFPVCIVLGNEVTGVSDELLSE